MRDSDVQRMIDMTEKNLRAGGEIMAGDGGYSEGTKEAYEAFVKVRNESLDLMKLGEIGANNQPQGN